MNSFTSFTSFQKKKKVWILVRYLSCVVFVISLFRQGINDVLALLERYSELFVIIAVSVQPIGPTFKGQA